jgi:hypothetical protein
MSHVAPRSDPLPALPVLEYGNPTDRLSPPPPPIGIRIAFFGVSLLAAASPFLPFTFDTSPLDVWIEFFNRPTSWDWELLSIATPFFLGLPLAAWHSRRLFRRQFGRGERLVMWGLGISGAALTNFLIGRATITQDMTPRDVREMTPPLLALVGGVVAVTCLLRRRYRDDAALVVLGSGYACNAAILLISMYSPTHVGWWVTLIAMIGMTAEWAYLCVSAFRASR